MKGEKEIEAMHAAGPPKQYYNAAMPLLTLLQELEKHQQVRYIHVQRGSDSPMVQNQALV
jgi:oxaloacetate decarboxylase alpha subunit